MFDDEINSRRLQGTDKKHNYFHPFNFELFGTAVTLIINMSITICARFWQPTSELWSCFSLCRTHLFIFLKLSNFSIKRHLCLLIFCFPQVEDLESLIRNKQHCEDSSWMLNIHFLKRNCKVVLIDNIQSIHFPKLLWKTQVVWKLHWQQPLHP